MPPPAKVKIPTNNKPKEVEVEEVEEVETPRSIIPAKVGPNGVTIGREDFVFLLESVKHGLSRRDIVEQSSCAVIVDGYVKTYNEEVMCSVPSGFPKDWRAAVLHKPLLDQLLKWPDDSLTVNMAEGFKVSASSRILELNMERQVLLPTETVEKPGATWKPLHEDLTDAIGIVESCAGKDESNQALTCIHITADWFEACDNFQLTRYNFKTGIGECCVKRDSLKIIPELDMREFNETKTWLHFRNRTGLIVSIRKHEEQYNDLAPYLEVTGVKTVLPKSVSEAVERAKLQADENADNPQIKVDLAPGRIVIRGEGASGYFEEAKKVKYTGTRIRFSVSPTLFLELVTRHTDCVVSPQHRIKVDGPKWRYIACLDAIEDKS